MKLMRCVNQKRRSGTANIRNLGEGRSQPPIWRWNELGDRAVSMVILLVLLVLAHTAYSYAQTLYVYSPSQGNLSNNGYVYIVDDNTDWPMPELNISFGGLASCDSVSLDIKMAWLDPYTSRETQYDTGSVTINGTDAWLLDGPGWGYQFGSDTNSEGGYATLSYQINGGPVQYFYFNIGGLNPDQGQVDNFYNSLAPPVAPTPPWFWGNILAEESSGQQYYASGCPVPDPINVNNCPLVEGNPDGIGISQVDGVKNPSYVNDSLYWNFEENIEEALVILQSSQSGAYTFWSKQVTQSNGTPVPTSLNTPCKGSYFSYPQTGSWNFEDAEWIQAYNGTSHGYFIVWNAPGYPLQWSINYPYENSDYVHQVCGKTPY